MESCAEVRRHPEEVKPPDRIGEKLGNGKRPRLPVAEQSPPRYCGAHLGSRFLVDMVQLNAGERGVIGGLAVLAEPPKDPARAEDAGDQKGGMPAITNRHPRHDDWSHNCS